MNRLFALCLIIAVCALLPVRANAIVIDDFKSLAAGHVAQALGAGNQVTDTKAVVSAIGGSRKISATVTAGPRVQASQFVVPLSSGYFSHNSDNASSGVTQIVWDGQSSDPSIVPKFNGLNMPTWVGVDLLNMSGNGDNATKFILKDFNRDSADGGDATIRMDIYDARNAQRRVSKTITITSAQANTTFDIDQLSQFGFSSFTSTGTLPSQVDHFAHVGAIHVIVTGTVALDLSFTKIQTDGCPTISPVAPSPLLTGGANVFVRDACFVCNGSSKICTKCDGGLEPYSITPGFGSIVPGVNSINPVPPSFIENGGGSCTPLTPPDVGECAGRTGTYSVLTPATLVSAVSCTCVSNKQPSNDICDGKDNDCDGQVDEPDPVHAIYDQCNVCGGNNSTCKGCDNVPNSGKVFDVCNVCGGNGTSCLGCDNIPNSGKVIDVCNVCGGNGKSCLGCDGVANSGKTIDACNICGGDGKSCAGCDGVAGSGKKKDICGICAGDGTSCTSACQKTEIRETLFQLDAQAKEAEKVIIRASRSVTSNSKGKKFATQLKRLLVDAHNKQVANWILSWTLPEVINSCQNDVVCFKSSNTERLDTYRTTAGELLKLNDQLASILRKIGLAGRGKVLERNGRAVYSHALELAGSVPETTTVCNVGTSLP